MYMPFVIVRVCSQVYFSLLKKLVITVFTSAFEKLIFSFLLYNIDEQPFRYFMSSYFWKQQDTII